MTPSSFLFTCCQTGAEAALKKEVAREHPELRKTLWENVARFREGMQSAGFKIPESAHPIVPVILGDAVKTKAMAARMFAQGIYVVGFSYPVVPEGTARIRVQISAAHIKEDIDKAVRAFIEARD